MPTTTLHLRDEALPIGYIAPITPSTAASLIAASFALHIESSTHRPYPDAAYVAAGCTLVPANSWPAAPPHHIIVSGKLLDEPPHGPLKHVHVHAAHIFKRQKGWQDTLRRYRAGGGTLLAVDSLGDGKGGKLSRVEREAGVAGTAVALKAWCWGLLHPEAGAPGMPGSEPYRDSDVLYREVLQALEVGRERNGGVGPRVLVVGAGGRCGRGVLEFLERVGVKGGDVTRWGRKETERGGPFEEICEHDVMMNCIYNAKPIRPFVTRESIRQAGKGRRLSVVGDITCDIHTPGNAVPIYGRETTLGEPTVRVEVAEGRGLVVAGMICFPALLTREASDATSEALLPSLLKLGNWRREREWLDVEGLFKEALGMLEREEQEERERKRVVRGRNERFGKLIRASL